MDLKKKQLHAFFVYQQLLHSALVVVAEVVIVVNQNQAGQTSILMVT